ncbi:MAG: endonuclease/exonuclease/phosphatase family protein, partial [Candidatus Thiodiazotropha sp.]
MPSNVEIQKSLNLNLLTLNCQSWNTCKQGIGHLLENNNIGILCLSETWESETNPVNFQNWEVFSKSREGGHGGVAILVKPSKDFLVQKVNNVDFGSLEAVCVKVNTKTHEIVILNVYIPPEKTDLMRHLIVVAEILSRSYKNLVITGDLNAKSLEWGNSTSNTAGNILEACMHELQLCCLNDDQPTRRYSDSIIDLFIVSPSVLTKCASCETLTHEYVRSDHISVKLALDCFGKVETVVREERYSIKNTDWSVWEEVTEEKFKTFNQSVDGDESMNVLYNNFITLFNDCIEEAVPKRQVKINGMRKRPLWYNDNVKKARAELNQARRAFKRRRTPTNLFILRQKEDEVGVVEENAKNIWTEELCQKVSDASSQAEMWRHFKTLTSYQEYDDVGVLPLINSNNNPIFENEEKAELLKDTFFSGTHLQGMSFDNDFQKEIEGELSKIKTQEHNVTDCQEDLDFLNRNITEEEVEAVLQMLKTGVSPGPDNIYTELLLHSGEELQKAIHTLFDRSWQEGCIPQDWRHAEVKFLKKAGKKSYHFPSSYRPISLTSCLGKALERII